MSTDPKQVNKIKKNSRRVENNTEPRFIERLIKLVEYQKLQKVVKS